MKKNIAEAFGTFTLVFVGCGSALFAGEAIGLTGISLAFGLSVVAMAYGIGPISGAHLNPAVSLGVHLAGRMSMAEMIQYWISQIVGGVVAGILLMIMHGSNISGAANVVGEFGFFTAVLFEIIATFIFVTVILGATQKGSPAAMAGLVIGLTLAMVHLVGIPISGVSVNPARSIATNLWSGTGILNLPIFLIAPLIGGAAAGILHKAGITSAAEE